MTTLRVLGWDDPRGREPLAVAAERFDRVDPSVDVRVTTRPLAAFEDQPIEEVIRSHDVMCIDHPFIGEAASRGYFVPLDDHIESAVLDAHRRDAIGPSWDSYGWRGRQWAFPMDVACQVSALRDDLMSDLGLPPPDSLQAVLGLARQHPGAVALSLNPTHSFCTFITLCAGAAGGRADATGLRVPRDVGLWALEWLQELVAFVHPSSATSDPVEVLDAMSVAHSKVRYCPFVFGYSNYARPGYRPRRITFGGVVSARGDEGGSILGGVGLAVSAESTIPEIAAQFAASVADAAFQRDHLFAAGGQPASRSAWDDPELDRRCGGFFSSTRETTEKSFVRPRFDGFHSRQRSMAATLHRLIWEGGSAASVVDSLLEELTTEMGARP